MSKGMAEELGSCGVLQTIPQKQRLAERNGRRLWRAAGLCAGLVAVSFAVAGPWAAARADGGYSSSSSGSAQSVKEPVIELDVANANLETVLLVMRKQSHAQIMVVSGNYQPVTLTLTAPLSQALRYVARSAGATVVKDQNGVYTFQPADASPAASDLTFDANVGPQQDTAPVLAPPAPVEAMHTERIVLQNVDPNYILIMMNETSGLRSNDPFENPINQSKMASQLQPMQITPGSIPIQTMTTEAQQPNAQGQAQEPSVPLASNVYAGGNSSQANRAAMSSGNQANQFSPPFGGGIPGQGGFGQFPTATPGGGIPGQVGGANGQGGNLRPQGIDSIIANEQDNSLIVRGTADGIAQLKQIINFLDRSPKQVQIKLEYVTTNVADADTFGISWELLPFPNVDSGFNGGGPTGQGGETFLSYAQGNLVTRLAAILSNSKGKVVAAPIITTTNNTPATINFSSQVPYQTTTTVAQGSGNAITGNQVNFLTIVNALTVTPRINGDNSVSLLLNVTLSTPGTPPFSGGPPPVSTQSVTTYRTVADGETMVMGGLVNKNVTNTQLRVPFLSQLPIIGSLFRTRDENVSDTELLIFMTPTVLPPIGAGMSSASSSGGDSGSSVGGVGVGVTP